MEPYTSITSGHKALNTTIFLVLLGFLGLAGLHRFYTGKTITGFLFFITGGFLGLGTLIDLFVIIVGGYRCKNGEPLYR